jgi:hypothetical protein
MKMSGNAATANERKNVLLFISVHLLFDSHKDLTRSSPASRFSLPEQGLGFSFKNIEMSWNVNGVNAVFRGKKLCIFATIGRRLGFLTALSQLIGYPQ